VRQSIRVAAILLAAVTLWPSSASARAAHPTVTCRSSDLRYPFRKGGPRTFGVFRLRITHGSCTTAHRVARSWMKTFEANLRAGRVRLPHSVGGFGFTTLPATAAQEYRERGRNGRATILFRYRVPNG
jgi:hypothetical protein